MLIAKKRVIGQLVLGPSERRRFAFDDIVAALRDAVEIAGLDIILFWPSRDETFDSRVRAAFREFGIKSYLWLPMLADAGVEPDSGQWMESAWGVSGQGTLGRWRELGRGDESFLFACPRDEKQFAHIRRRIDRELPEYDGVFLDRIRYPSTANGIEMLFTCFCPRCMEMDRDAAAWRERALDFRSMLAEATDADLASWVRWRYLVSECGLDDLVWNRTRVITELAAKAASAARSMGKEVGLDLYTPSLAKWIGQDYRTLGPLADWIKPMSYFRAKGPAGMPLELASLARGFLELGRKLSAPAVMRFIGESLDIPILPESPDILETNGLDEGLAGGEYLLAAKRTSCALYPGFECVRHPDFDLNMTENGIQSYLKSFAGAPGVCMAWNILYTPRKFFELVAEGR